MDNQVWGRAWAPQTSEPALIIPDPNITLTHKTQVHYFVALFNRSSFDETKQLKTENGLIHFVPDEERTHKDAN